MERENFKYWGVNFKAEENNKGNNNYYSYPWLSGKHSAYCHFWENESWILWKFQSSLLKIVLFLYTIVFFQTDDKWSTLMIFLLFFSKMNI